MRHLSVRATTPCKEWHAASNTPNMTTLLKVLRRTESPQLLMSCCMSSFEAEAVLQLPAKRTPERLTWMRRDSARVRATLPSSAGLRRTSAIFKWLVDDPPKGLE